MKNLLGSDWLSGRALTAEPFKNIQIFNIEQFDPLFVILVSAQRIALLLFIAHPPSSHLALKKEHLWSNLTG